MKTESDNFRRRWDIAQFTQHKLSNGINVWIQKPLISINHMGYLSIFFKGVGSANDPYGYEGLAHFLEHILFRRDVRTYSKNESVEDIIQKGGRVDAATNNMCTQYFIQIDQSNFSKAAEVLYSIVNKPSFNSVDIDIEKRVILQEIRNNRIVGKKLKNQHVLNFLYKKKNPYIHKSAGYPGSVNRINQDILINFLNQHYHAGNANIVCGGNFSDIPNVLEILEEIFGKMRGGIENQLIKQPLPTRTAGHHKLRDRRYENESLSLSYFLPNIPWEEIFPLKILIPSLTYDSLSPLWINIREKRGLAYNITSGISYFNNLTVLGFNFDVSSIYFIEIEEIFLKTLLEINEAYLIHYLQKLKRERLGEFQSPADACLDLPNELMNYGRPYSFSQYEDLMDAVEIQEILDWRDKLLNMEPLIFEFTRK